MTTKNKDVIEVMKAWAFPTLVAVIAFFMRTIYGEFQEMKTVQVKILERLAVHDESHRDIERRLDQNEEEIKELTKFQEMPRNNTSVFNQLQNQQSNIK